MRHGGGGDANALCRPSEPLRVRGGCGVEIRSRAIGKDNLAPCTRELSTVSRLPLCRYHRQARQPKARDLRVLCTRSAFFTAAFVSLGALPRSPRAEREASLRGWRDLRDEE